MEPNTTAENANYTITNGSVIFGDIAGGIIRRQNLTEGDYYFIISTSLDELRKEIKWFFQLHAYLFGCMFFILAFYSFSSILNIRSQISRRRFMTGINAFLCILGLSRAIFLFIDPYGFSKVLPTFIINALWAVGFPAITSSFCLLQLAVLHLTKLKIGPSILRGEVFLRIVITFHMFSSVIKSVISTVNHSKTTMMIDISCEIIFIWWSVFVYISFLFIGYEVFQHLDRVPISTMLNNNQNKGIMQMVMLAPQSNLASSVTAALMPTILRSSDMKTTQAPAKITPAVVDPSCDKPNLNGNKNISSSGELALGEGAAKMKKLKWQSSISNGSKIECGEFPSKKILPTSQRPILKESNRIEKKPKLESEIEIKESENSNKVSPSKEVQSSQKPSHTLEKQESSGIENDLLLHSILNHIAYVNRANSDAGFAHCSPNPTPMSKKRQVHIVLKFTYATAILGLFVCALQLFEKAGPYGLLGSLIQIESVNAYYWLLFQTVYRICEVLMAGTIANITKQPSSSVHRYLKHNPSAMIKQRESMFI